MRLLQKMEEEEKSARARPTGRKSDVAIEMTVYKILDRFWRFWKERWSKEEEMFKSIPGKCRSFSLELFQNHSELRKTLSRTNENWVMGEPRKNRGTVLVYGHNSILQFGVSPISFVSKLF
jgi:hypothetical protein